MGTAAVSRMPTETINKITRLRALRALAALWRLIESRRHELALISEHSVLKHPEPFYETKKNGLLELHRRAQDAPERKTASLRGDFLPLAKKLDALSPLATLSRGYSVVSSTNGIVRSVTEIEVDSEISIRLCDGVADARITRKG